MKFPIFFDNQSTTPVDPRVVDAMLPFLKDQFGNVASDHYCGRNVRTPVQKARAHVADLLGADPREIVFTSGATESNNLAIKGVLEANEERLGKHIVTAATEHKAVLDTCLYMKERGFDVTVLPVDRLGQVTPEQVAAAMRNGAQGSKDRTCLVSLMGANNEIGTCHPVEEISQVVTSAGAIFHVDAAQTVGKIPIDMARCKVDLLSMSAHKMYGPKGVGALYVRSGGKDFPVASQIHGGGQEKGLRSGTLAVPMIVALGEACRIAAEELEQEHHRILSLRKLMLAKLQAAIPNVRFNGHPTQRLPGNISATFPGIDGELLMLGLHEVCCSSTSACASDREGPSYVLKAIGLSDEDASATLRIGIGRFNTEAEVDYLVDKLREAVASKMP